MITFEETIQTVLNLIQEREKLRLELQKVKAENVRLSDELTVMNTEKAEKAEKEGKANGK